MLYRSAGVPLVALAMLLWASSARAHGVEHEVTCVDAVVVRFWGDDGSPFAFESYEVRVDEEDDPVQVGETDRLGRVMLVPDRQGEWRVRVFSEHGHGASVTIAVDSTGWIGAGASRSATGLDRGTRLIGGAGLVLGLFGIVSLVRSRR